jgi:RNA polymerase sigma-70 factor (ECF subfamily)
MTEESAFESLRPLMFSIAYRMLGRVSEAEDIVQEAFLRYHRAVAGGLFARPGQSGPGEPDSPKAYLSAVTTRLCIDYSRSAQVRREAYVGEWLPEPVLTGQAGLLKDPAELAEQADSLSMAFLLLLERLSPVERAVFLLHDVFGYGYDETARIVDKSEDNCRQLARRARQHVAEQRPRYEPSRDKRDELAGKFLAAVGDGDMDALVSMLAEDAAVYGDSGGQRPSWPRPIVGRQHVGRLLAALSRQARLAGAVLHPAEVNGQPGLKYLAADGTLIAVMALDIADGQVHAVRSVISRDKLRHLGPLTDLEELISLRRAGPAEPGDRPAP